MEIERNYGELIRINAPEFYKDQKFLDWLNRKDRYQATWHVKGMAVGEFSDLFFQYDNGEGSDSDMPEHIWEQLTSELKKLGVTWGLVWISNLPE